MTSSKFNALLKLLLGSHHASMVDGRPNGGARIEVLLMSRLATKLLLRGTRINVVRRTGTPTGYRRRRTNRQSVVG
jgi:hypothetical protein